MYWIVLLLNISCFKTSFLRRYNFDQNALNVAPIIGMMHRETSTDADDDADDSAATSAVKKGKKKNLNKNKTSKSAWTL